MQEGVQAGLGPRWRLQKRGERDEWVMPAQSPGARWRSGVDSKMHVLVHSAAILMCGQHACSSWCSVSFGPTDRLGCVILMLSQAVCAAPPSGRASLVQASGQQAAQVQHGLGADGRVRVDHRLHKQARAGRPKAVER